MEQEQNCPGCGNRCPQDDLQCGRGKRYFGSEGEPRQERREHGAEGGDEIVNMVRKCGHFLHHSGKTEIAVRSLTTEERSRLLELLGKCYTEWTEK